jgi:hypothetical protein
VLLLAPSGHSEKRLRLAGLLPELKPNTDLSTLTAAQLNPRLVNLDKEEQENAGAFAYLPKFWDAYYKNQTKLVKALSHQHDVLVQRRCRGRLPNMYRARAMVDFLLGLFAQSEGNPNLQDAVAYRLCCWLALSVFESDKGRFADNWKLVTNEDSVAFYDTLVERALRHIPTAYPQSSTSTASLAPSITSSLGFSGALVTSSSLPMPSTPASQPSASRFCDPSSEDAKKYYVDIASMQNVTEWDDLTIDAGFKDMIMDEVENAKWQQMDPPAGVLLYGPQGTGKTQFVYSFCRKFNAKLIAVPTSAKGSLQGQCEKYVISLP